MPLYLKGGEPHEPVQTVVVGGDQAGGSRHVARFALELVLFPNCSGAAGVKAVCALKYDFRSLFGHTAKTEVLFHHKA